MNRIIELHVASGRLLTLILNRAKWVMPCTQEFPLENPATGIVEDCVLDHVSFVGGEIVRDEEQVISVAYGSQTIVVNPIQVRLFVKVFIKTNACLNDPACPADSYILLPFNLVPQVTLVFNLSVSADQLCATFVEVQNPLGSADNTLNLGIPQDLCSGLQLGPLPALLGVSGISHSGLSLNADATQVGVRIEFSGPGALTSSESWKSFYAGSLATDLPGKDWSVFIDAGLFKEGVVAKFEPKLQSSDKIDVTSPLASTWFPLGLAGGMLQISFSGDIEVDEGPVSCTIGLDPVTVQMTFSADAAKPNFLKASGKLSWDAVDSDVFSCAMPWGLLAGSVNAILGLTVQIIFAIVASEFEPDEGNIPLPENCTSTSNTTFECLQPIEVPPLTLGNLPASESGSFTLDTTMGVAQGLVIGGFLTVKERSESPLKLDWDGFQFGIKGDCQDLRIGYIGGGTLSGFGRLCPTKADNDALVLQYLQVIDDPLGVFRAIWPHSEASGHWLWLNTFYVDFADASFLMNAVEIREQYFQNPYPCRLVVRSSAGCQCFELPPPERGSEKAFEQELLARQADCSTWAMYFDPLALTAHWHTDPEPLVNGTLILGETAVRAKVRIYGLRFVSSSMIQGSAQRRGLIELRNAKLGLSGAARVSATGLRTFRAPIRKEVRTDITVVAPDRHGPVLIEFAKPVRTSIDVPSIHLPREVSRLTVDLELNPADLVLSGQLVPTMMPK